MQTDVSNLKNNIVLYIKPSNKTQYNFKVIWDSSRLDSFDII